MLEKLKADLHELSKKIVNVDAARKATEKTLEGMNLEIDQLKAQRKLLKFQIEQAEWAEQWTNKSGPMYGCLEGELYPLER